VWRERKAGEGGERGRGRGWDIGEGKRGGGGKTGKITYRVKHGV